MQRPRGRARECGAEQCRACIVFSLLATGLMVEFWDAWIGVLSLLSMYGYSISSCIGHTPFSIELSFENLYSTVSLTYATYLGHCISVVF